VRGEVRKKKARVRWKRERVRIMVVADMSAMLGYGLLSLLSGWRALGSGLG